MVKSILVDMSATIIHHGHIRLLGYASQLGSVTVGLVTDDEISKFKGYVPELTFPQRSEILKAIRYVDNVIPAPWLIDQEFMDLHRFDILVHGSDNVNVVAESQTVIVPRTEGVSSSALRARFYERKP